MSMNVGGLRGAQHLLQALGLDLERMLDKVEDLQDHMGNLAQLGDAFQGCSGMSPQALAGMLQGGQIPGQGAVSRPDSGCCSCPGQYAQPQTFDLGASADNSPMGQIMGRLQGGMFERFLQQNPFAKAQVEMMLGGKILPDGNLDGKIQVQPFPQGHAPAGGQHSPAASQALQMLDALNRAAMGGLPGGGMPGGGALPGLGQGGPGNMMNGMLPLMMLGALQQLLQGGGGAGAAPAGGGAAPAGGGGSSPLYANGGRDGSGGLFVPRKPGQGGAGGVGGTGAPDGSPEDLNGIMNDSSLTVEDKVTLMLMQIMKKMDKDIEAQGQRINQLQQQQQGGGGAGGAGGGAGGAGGAAGGAGGAGGGGGGNPSIDVETMKLKRMIDKRSQMFDTLRQIIDKYNETAKNMIQSIGR